MNPGHDYVAIVEYPVYALMVEFMAYTGLRAAEVSGLEIRDLVFSPGPRCSVNVQRTKDRKGGEWVTGTLKSKRSRRAVPLPGWLAERMVTYLAEHPRADELTAPLWPSRKNGGGYRATGQRYAVPLDWSRPLALGAFYDTIMKPALEAVGLPASRPATQANTGHCDNTSNRRHTGGSRGTSPRPTPHLRGSPALGGGPLHAGVEVAGALDLHLDLGGLRRLRAGAGRRRAQHPAGATRPCEASPGARQRGQPVWVAALRELSPAEEVQEITEVSDRCRKVRSS